MTAIVPVRCNYDTTAVSAYLVVGPELTLIDSGGVQHPPLIEAAVAAAGRDLTEVRRILNTHGHWDHAGGNAEIVAHTGASVEIHELGTALLESHESHLNGYYTVAARMMDRSRDLAAQRAGFRYLMGGPTQAARTWRDGDLIEVGEITFEVLHVPGHSADHCALFNEADGTLISGDAAQGTGSRVGGGPLYFESLRQALVSLERLRGVPFRRLLVSHPFGQLGSEARTMEFDAGDGQRFLRESAEVLDLIVAAADRVSVRDSRDFPAFARAVTEDLVKARHWSTVVDPSWGVHPALAATLAAYWRERPVGHA